MEIHFPFYDELDSRVRYECHDLKSIDPTIKSKRDLVKKLEKELKKRKNDKSKIL